MDKGIPKKAFQMINYIDQRKAKREWNSRFIQNMSLGMKSPDAFFHELGEVGDEVFRVLRDAQDDYILELRQLVGHRLAELLTVGGSVYDCVVVLSCA